MVTVPGGALQTGAASRKWDQVELARAGDEKAVQVWRVDVPVGRPLRHWGRVLDHGEAQEARRVPFLNRLHEGAGGELAVADGSCPMPIDVRADRIRDSRAEEPFRRFGQVRKVQYAAPDHFRRGVHDDGGPDGEL